MSRAGFFFLFLSLSNPPFCCHCWLRIFFIFFLLQLGSSSEEGSSEEEENKESSDKTGGNVSKEHEPGHIDGESLK